MILPDLSGLSLAGVRAAPHVSKVAAKVPQSAIDTQVARGNLSSAAAQATGVIVSAGQSKRVSMGSLIDDFKPTSTWRANGWQYAHYATGDTVYAKLVLVLQIHDLAFTFLGGAEVKPSAFVIALLQEYWGKNGLNTTGSVLDWFYNDRDGSYTRGLFEKILNDSKRMPHWKDNHFKTTEDVMAAVRAGKKLPIMWLDDGMLFVEEYVQSTTK